MSKAPKATHIGDLHIGEMVIPCAVLEDGTRVLTQSGFMRALGRARQAKGRDYYDSDVNMPAFLTAKNLKPFISEDLQVTSSQIEFRLKGRRAFGYRAELLPQVCAVFVDADDAGEIHRTQSHVVTRCRILMRGLATVGIIALVDEATGYQYDRAREALAEILEQFIAKALCKWVKTFPDDYYQELFRLRGWHYQSFSTKRPILAGKLTNDIVYQRLAPGVLGELRRKNPLTPKGWRKDRHHQWLTPSLGHPRLREHLAAVIALMRSSNSWGDFKRGLERALPKYLPMPLFAQPTNG